MLQKVLRNVGHPALSLYFHYFLTVLSKKLGERLKVVSVWCRGMSKNTTRRYTMHTLLRCCPIDASKSLCDTYKFKLYTLKKSLFSAFSRYFWTKSLFYNVDIPKITSLTFFHIRKNPFSGFFSVVTERSLHCLSFKTSAKNHYFWFSLTLSSLSINSAPRTLFIIHIFIDPQTRE